MSEVLNIVLAWMMIYATLVTGPAIAQREAEQRAEIKRHIKDQTRMDDAGRRCERGTSQALTSNDAIDLITIDVDCCTTPNGTQCYVTKRGRVFKW